MPKPPTRKDPLRGSSLRRKLDRYGLVPVVWALGIRGKRAVPSSPKRIVLLQTAAIGDSLLMAGAIRCLRASHPGAKLVLVLGADNRAVYQLLPKVDEVHSIRPYQPVAAVRTLRSLAADILVDFGPWPRINALLAALSGSKFTLGFSTKGQARHFAYDTAVPHRNDVHELVNQQALIGKIADIGSWDYRVLAQDASGVIQKLNLQQPYVIFHPWASGSGKPLKEWPAEHWSKLAHWCASKKLAVYITGGPSDVISSEELATSIQKPDETTQVSSLAGKVSLPDTAALLAGAQAVVSVNTGIMHLAGFIGVRTVGLSGPTDPRRWGPVGPRVVSVQPSQGQIAYLNLGFEYPAGVEPCMNFLSPEAVISALEALFANS